MSIVSLAGALQTLPEDCTELPTGSGQSSWSGYANALLTERGKTHGDWKVQSEWSQRLKQLLTETPNWESLPPGMKEALHLKATKWTRILHGNPFERDHRLDDSGYSELVAKQL